MYDRAQYRKHDENTRHNWRSIPDPIGTIKYDGANYWMPVAEDGSLSFISRRESVKGGYPDRTQSLPHLTDIKLPQYAGHIYNVELIHTGDGKNNVESHRAVSGILNSLPDKAILTQMQQGPVRAVLHNVINPVFGSYKDKLKHLKEVEAAFNKPDLVWATHAYEGHKAVQALIDATKIRNQEGIIVTSASRPEGDNVRVKIVHKILHNLKVVRILQEFAVDGTPKQSMGSVEVADASGRVVGNVGTGFSRAQRIEAFENPSLWIGRLIQVESRGMSKDRLRMPVYNGDADGDLDLIA